MGESLNIMWRSTDRSNTVVCLETQMQPNDANVNWKSRDMDTVRHFHTKAFCKITFFSRTLDFPPVFFSVNMSRMSRGVSSLLKDQALSVICHTHHYHTV